jgi:hypothetical protein
VAHVQWFPAEITGLDAGDVDGDGQNELVFTSKDTVFVYRWREGTFYRVQVVKGSWSPNFIYVSLADVDKNGRDEVYVSNLSASNVSSLVLEWQGDRLKPVAEKEPWLFRATDIPGMGRMLLGQLRVSNGLYKGSVQILRREKDGFVVAGPLPLPRFGNVFNFVEGFVADAKKPHTVLLSPYERLLLYDPRGEKIWESEEHYGGSLTFMDDETHRRAGDIGAAPERHYIASPLLAVDRGEGKQQVVICQNESRVGRVLGHMRTFSSGKVHFMGWDGVGLSPRWTSNKLGGPVTGYTVKDVNHDGKADLVAAAVTQEDHALGKPRSQLVVYRLR